jgi:L-alanine-DL-glutamate epimerase-like enolase superfamily enzyme
MADYQASLSGHVIDKVEFKRFRARYPRLHGKNARLSYHGFGGDVAVAVLRTNQGAKGWGQIASRLDEAKAAAPLLEGKPLDTLFDCASGIMHGKLSPFDIALHDLAGVVAGVPVAKLVKDAASTKVCVYDGAIYMNDIIPEDRPFGVGRIVEECARDVALGHTALKVKIGRGSIWMPHDAGLARDIEVVRAIHAAFPGTVLMVDANDGYSLDDAKAFMEGIGDAPIYWFEEPFREESGRNAALKAYLQKERPLTLIADGESMTDIPLLRNLAEQGVMDVWQPDVLGHGFTAWRRLMAEIVRNGWLASPHAWGTVVKTHYCAHLAAAYPHHIPMIEAVLGESEGVDYGGYGLKDGMMSLPDKPGFGMDLFYAPEA